MASGVPSWMKDIKSYLPQASAAEAAEAAEALQEIEQMVASLQKGTGASLAEARTALLGLLINQEPKTYQQMTEIQETFLAEKGVASGQGLTEEQLKELAQRLSQIVMPPEAHRCRNCNHQALLACKVCQKVLFCSRRCERNSRHVHRKVCKFVPKK